MKKMFKKIVFLACCFWVTNCAYAESIQNPEPYFVGELGSAWQFPSDHLPIGMTIEHFHIAFWNILNKNYLYHIEANTQGLKDSSILKDNMPLPGQKNLTIREFIVIQQIQQMISHPTHPRSLIALQETHNDVLNHFRKYLPEQWVVITPPEQSKSQDIFLYNSDVFDFVDVIAEKYSPDHPKTIFTLILKSKESGRVYRFVQSHIPGGPVDSVPSCKKFAKEALKQYDPNLTTILMGDMNQSPATISIALEEAAKEQSLPCQPFQSVAIDYPSHINTCLHASWIDHFFIYTPYDQWSSTNNPEELCSLLVPTVKLLKEHIQGKFGPYSLRWDPTTIAKDFSNGKKEDISFCLEEGFVYANFLAKPETKSLEELRQEFFKNLEKNIPNAVLQIEEERMVNGVNMLYLKIKGDTEGPSAVIDAYLYSGQNFTTIVSVTTNQEFYSMFEKKIFDFLNSILISA